MRYAETDRIELKERMTDELKKEIVAFLNTEGGTIYVGVKDDGTPSPIQDPGERDAMDLRLSNWVRDAFYPNVFGLVRYAFQDDGVFAIEVNQGLDKPYYLKEKGPKPSGVYVRIGTTSRMATESEILLMLLDSRKYSYEEDVAEEQNLTFRFFNDICDENHIPHEERSLRSLRLIDKDGKYTNLAFMLSDQSDIVVKLAKYDRHLNFITKKEFKGSLLKCLENVLDVASTFNDVSAIISPDSWQRKETVSYPGSSLREAILNAFCHSNYFIRSNIKIEFFDDKVRITNPGGIYQATLEQIMEGVQTYRNPALVNILNKLHYIENFGTGIPRILQAYEGFPRQPEWNPTGNFFMVTLPNQNYSGSGDDSENDSRNDSRNDSMTLEDRNLSPRDLAILRSIQAHPGIGGKQILESIEDDYPGTTPFDLKNTFKRKIRDFVTFKGAKKNGGYYIKENLGARKVFETRVPSCKGRGGMVK